jgi:cytochrome c553
MKTIWMLIAAGMSCSAIGADIKAGETKAQACVGCHGAQGKSLVPTFPKLAGQHAVYIESALHEFKSGERKNQLMAPFAAGLSEVDIADIAAYFEAQK